MLDLVKHEYNILFIVKVDQGDYSTEELSMMVNVKRIYFR